jgi:hypothetical protein
MSALTGKPNDRLVTMASAQWGGFEQPAGGHGEEGGTTLTI